MKKSDNMDYLNYILELCAYLENHVHNIVRHTNPDSLVNWYKAYETDPYLLDSPKMEQISL